MMVDLAMGIGDKLKRNCFSKIVLQFFSKEIVFQKNSLKNVFLIFSTIDCASY